MSRMTARNAMQRLVQEGIVQRVPGRGSFVSEQPVHRQAGSLISFSDEMRRQGRRPSSRLLRRGRRSGSGRRRQSWRCRRWSSWCGCRLADGGADRDRVLGVRRCAGRCAAVRRPRAGSLFDALVGAGHVPTAGRASLGAGGATAFDAEHLGLVEGAPLLVERRLILDQRGRPLERTESRYAADRYSLDVSFDVDLGLKGVRPHTNWRNGMGSDPWPGQVRCRHRPVLAAGVTTSIRLGVRPRPELGSGSDPFPDYATGAIGRAGVTLSSCTTRSVLVSCEYEPDHGEGGGAECSGERHPLERRAVEGDRLDRRSRRRGGRSRRRAGARWRRRRPRRARRAGSSRSPRR